MVETEDGGIVFAPGSGLNPRGLEKLSRFRSENTLENEGRFRLEVKCGMNISLLKLTEPRKGTDIGESESSAGG